MAKQGPKGIHFTSLPLTEPPPHFIPDLVGVFKAHRSEISTEELEKGLTSDQVLAVLGDDLRELGFEVERSKAKADKIERPVFFGEDGVPTLRYEIDAYHADWQCALEVEAGRAWMGNAVYRDLIQAAVMVGVKHLCIGAWTSNF